MAAPAQPTAPAEMARSAPLSAAETASAAPASTAAETPPVESETNVSTQDLINKMVGMRKPKPQGEEAAFSDDEVSQIKTETRFFIQDAKETLEEVLPDATRGQTNSIISALIDQDLGLLVKSILAANRTAMEKDEKADDDKELHVEGANSGVPSEKLPAKAKNMAGAIDNALKALRA